MLLNPHIATRALGRESPCSNAEEKRSVAIAPSRGVEEGSRLCFVAMCEGGTVRLKHSADAA